MNCEFRPTGTGNAGKFTAPSGTAKSSRRWLFGSTALARCARTAISGLAGSLALASPAYALPSAGVVSAGSAAIASTASTLTVKQTTQNAAINWQGFSIGQGETVQFVQPSTSSVALNRVLGPDPSTILGSLSANGKVFLVNPNGILFGTEAQVNVAGLVASTLNITDANFMSGQYKFSGAGGGAVLNRGSINSDGGFVALLGANVSNDGVISARLGAVALAAGNAVTLDVAGDGLLNVTVNEGAVNALVRNGGLIRADGGHVLMTAQAAGGLLRTAVNNTGVIEAQTIENHDGTIRLLGDMQSGAVNVSGTLDASAPSGGNGGLIETSAANVYIADDVRITTIAPQGLTGTWVIDPADFTISPTGGSISGATLSAQLVTNSVVISTFPAPGDTATGNGDIFVNDAISWTASGAPTTLTLNAFRDLNINAAITATAGNIVACCGRDVVVNAALTTTNGSILLNAGQTVRVFHAITTTDGNIALCAGHDVEIDAAVTLTRGTTIPAQSLGLPVGLTLIAGAAGTGPGVETGTVIFAPLTPPATVTVAPVTINYNPVSYAAPTDFSTNFVLTEGATLTQHMLLFPNGDKVFDGTNNAVLTSFNTTATSGLPTGVTLVPGTGATAVFDDSSVGSDIGITYSGYSLAGPNAGQYALAGSCCVSTFRTTGSITAAGTPPPVEVPPDVPPPPVVEVPPVVPPPPVVEVPPVVPPPPVVEVPPVVPPPPVVEVPPVVPPPPVVVDVPPVLPVPPPPVPALRVVPNPIVGLAPVVVEAPAGVQFAILNGGVRMPLLQVAAIPPVQQALDVVPVATPLVQPPAELTPAVQPIPPPLPPPVEITPYRPPVFPPKRARH